MTRGFLPPRGTVSTPAPVACPACSGGVAPGASRCPHCGAALGRLLPCPHCSAVAGASPHRQLRYVCDVCGGPRVPVLDPTFQPSGRELAPLRAAESARKGRAGWSAAAAVSGLVLPSVVVVFAVLSLLLGGPGLLLAGALFSAPVAALFVVAVTRARARARVIPPALDEAWLSVATELVRRANGPVPAAELAAKLGVQEPFAEELLALIEADVEVSAAPALDLPAQAPALDLPVQARATPGLRVPTDAGAAGPAWAQPERAGQTELAEPGTLRAEAEAVAEAELAAGGPRPGETAVASSRPGNGKP